MEAHKGNDYLAQKFGSDSIDDVKEKLTFHAGDGDAEVLRNCETDHLRLWNAVSDGDHSDVMTLLEKGANAKQTFEKGKTVLHLSSELGNLEIIKTLLASSADVNWTCDDGRTPLMFACERNQQAAALLLLDNGADINQTFDDGCSPLYIASREGSMELVRLLVSRGADVNKAKRNGWSPLMAACDKHHLEIVQLLLEKKADYDHQEKDGATSLYVALQRKRIDMQTDVVKLLLHGADVNKPLNSGCSPLMKACKYGNMNIINMLLENKADVNHCIDDGTTPLYIATLNGYTEIVNLLLTHGANANLMRKDSWGPLMMACYMNKTKGRNLDVIELLLKYGAKYDCRLSDGATPLYLAAQNNHSGAVKLLLSRGAGVNMQRNDGDTPLMTTCHHQHPSMDVIELLLKEREPQMEPGPICLNTPFVCAVANVNLERQDGWTALMLASEQGHLDIVNKLLDRGAKIDHQNKKGHTPLLIATQNSHNSIVEALVSRGCDVNLKQQDGDSALMTASAKGCIDIVKTLVNSECENRIDCNDHDLEGYTALYRACDNGHDETVKLLVDAEADINQQSVHGYTSLMVACTSKRFSCMDLLVTAGVSLDATSLFNTKALFYYCYRLGTPPYTEDMEKILMWFEKLVLESQLATNMLQVSDYHVTPLDMILIMGRQDIAVRIVESLVKKYGGSTISLNKTLYAIVAEMRIEAHLQETQTSLQTTMSAVFCLPGIDINILKCLLLNRDVKKKNYLKQSLFHMLAMESGLSSDELQSRMDLLIEMKECPRQVDANGRTPLHVACIYGKIDFVSMVIDYYPIDMLDRRKKDAVQKDAGAYIVQNPALDWKTKVALSEKMGLCEQLCSTSTSVFAETSIETIMKMFNCDKPLDKPGIECLFQQQLPQISEKEAQLLFDSSETGPSLHIAENLTIINDVTQFVKALCEEISRPDDIFSCIPVLCGSVREMTKCGKMTEMDFGLSLTNFLKKFKVFIHTEKGRKSAKIELHVCNNAQNRYWNDATSRTQGWFNSVKFCADLWLGVMASLTSEKVQNALRQHHLTVEDCHRKNGFVGHLYVQWHKEDDLVPITVDLNASVLCGDFVCLLRPRRSEFKILSKFTDNIWDFDLSSSPCDTELLLSVPTEVRNGYCLAKMIRNLMHMFKTESGNTVPADKLISSYTMKSAVMWLLDPDNKIEEVYPWIGQNRLFRETYEKARGPVQWTKREKSSDPCEYCDESGQCVVEIVSPHAHGPMRDTDIDSVYKDLGFIRNTAEEVCPEDSTSLEATHFSQAEVDQACVWARKIFWIIKFIHEQGELKNYHLCDQDIQTKDETLTMLLCDVVLKMLRVDN